MNLSGQSGRTSAVGMCIESGWRSVPLTGSTNPRTIGIAGTNPHRFFVVEPGGGFDVKPDKTVGKDEIDGGVEIRRVILTGKKYSGSDGFKVDPENAYYPLLGVLGTDVQAVVSAGQCFSHAMTPGKYAPSFTIEEQFGDHTYGRLTSGAIVSSITLDISDIVTAKMAYTGYRQIPNSYPNGSGALTSYQFGSTAAVLPNQMGGNGTITVAATASPSYVDVAESGDGNGPLVFAGLTFGSVSGFSSCYLLVDGSPANVQILKGISLEIDRTVSPFLTAGSGFDQGAAVGGAISVSGKLPLLFTDSSIDLAALSNSSCALNFRINGATIPGTSDVYAMEVYLPRIKFQESHTTRPATAMLAGGAFQATMDPTAGYSIMLTLVNTLDSSTLAGGAGTTGAAGGLGGWTN